MQEVPRSSPQFKIEASSLKAKGELVDEAKEKSCLIK
jgi:hypothetical protein